MTKICVIGNSHVGALKQGYDSLNIDSYEASFWCIPGGYGPSIDVEDGKIVVPSNRQHTVESDIVPHPGNELDLSGFDVVLLSGVGIPAIRKQNPTLHKKYAAGNFLGEGNHSGRQNLSIAMFGKLIEHELRQLDSFMNIDKLSSIFDKKILIQQFPMPTESVVNQPDFDAHYYGNKFGYFMSWYQNEQSLVLKKHAKRRNVSLVKYPAEWVSKGFTPSEYRSSDDSWHMNDKFGAFFMGDVLAERLRSFK